MERVTAGRSHDRGEGDGTEALEEARSELRSMRERFRSIIQSTPDGVIILDHHGGEILFANEAAERLFGRPADQLVGSSFGHPVVIGESTEIDIVRGGEPLVVELRVMETEWEGEPARIASLRDITARREAEQRQRELVREQVARAQAEEAARRAEILAEAGRRLASSIALDETLQNVVDFMADEVADYCVLDLVERDSTRRFGAAAPGSGLEEPIQVALEHPLDPDASTPQAAVFHSREPTLVHDVGDSWIRSAAQEDGHRRVMEELRPRSLIMVPLFTGRDCLGVLSMATTGEGPHYDDRDVQLAAELGRRAALAIENARLYRDAEAANEAKANFLSVMSHELRTPLSAIIGYADLLDRGVAGDVNEQQGQYLGRIRASSNHLLQIIEEILAFAGTEAGEESVQPEETNVGELMDAVVAVAEPLAREKPLDFEIQVDEPGSPMYTDVRKVRQVLLNLISNAIKFTEEGSVRVHVRPAGPDDERVEFEVRDTGIGIPRDRLDAIFERFTQVEKPLTRKVGGTGLGLSVAQSFVRMLDGSMRVESTEGEGSTFAFEIPRIHAD